MLVYDDETYDNPAIKELYDSIKMHFSITVINTTD